MDRDRGWVSWHAVLELPLDCGLIPMAYAHGEGRGGDPSYHVETGVFPFVRVRADTVQA